MDRIDQLFSDPELKEAIIRKKDATIAELRMAQKDEEAAKLKINKLNENIARLNRLIEVFIYDS